MDSVGEDDPFTAKLSFEVRAPLSDGLLRPPGPPPKAWLRSLSSAHSPWGPRGREVGSQSQRRPAGFSQGTGPEGEGSGALCGAACTPAS